MQVRAKFKCIHIAVSPGSDGTHTFDFQPVTSDTPENKVWSKWTPSGSMSLNVTNPDVFNAFTVGEEYFIDITPVKSLQATKPD